VLEPKVKRAAMERQISEGKRLAGVLGNKKPELLCPFSP